jgi:hypothetical protein
MMHRSLHNTVSALPRIIFSSLLLSGAIAVAQGPTFEQKREPSQPPLIHPEPFVKPPLVNRQFTGEIRRVSPQEVEVHIKEASETVMLHVRDEWTRQLKLAPGAVYGILAHQRHTPGGITTAVKFKDERGLYALAETIHDVPLFTPQDRDGLVVEQHPEGVKTFVYEDACKVVYNVPVESNVGREHILVQPHETKTIELSGKPYTVTLNTSQFIMIKECSITFEGGRSQLDYSMVRAEDGEK